mmetsp:Transcript_20636/g.52278  ORF Transcript_20636/g.52278 Transcript_20636/m.52278 type:complete len:337 (-) Transcript_20636:40-1050(-)|eukprot:CAMPEP_0202041872 /NCGR_PEP_ID=MMETSP0962-20130828/25351_1 /ASSEMBLY_ACC=CAM_ASM_000488 /TAXON_ID=4773 /ORGANISM="Schizochytrium aggregatum, Strain ATCC28209" /LENGTH=336 /DNA_ID=CAMNT_0048606231 /DNA_START=68 /DNA_END=1078 /DNA_ORIENTATION=-
MTSNYTQDQADSGASREPQFSSLTAQPPGDPPPMRSSAAPAGIASSSAACDAAAGGQSSARAASREGVKARRRAPMAKPAPTAGSATTTTGPAREQTNPDNNAQDVDPEHSMLFAMLFAVFVCIGIFKTASSVISTDMVLFGFGTWLGFTMICFFVEALIDTSGLTPRQSKMLVIKTINDFALNTVVVGSLILMGIFTSAVGVNALFAAIDFMAFYGVAEVVGLLMIYTGLPVTFVSLLTGSQRLGYGGRYLVLFGCVTLLSIFYAGAEDGTLLDVMKFAFQNAPPMQAARHLYFQLKTLYLVSNAIRGMQIALAIIHAGIFLVFLSGLFCIWHGA